MSNLIVQLSGGLGNQMFQYANARAIALRNNLDLVIDDWSGFYRDQEYKRKYMLKYFSISGRKVNFLESLPFLYVGSIIKMKKKINLINKFFFGNYIQEQSDKDGKSRNIFTEILNVNLLSNTWVSGYWQSPYYFRNCENLLKKELYPPNPISQKTKLLGEKILNTESAALGIRIYEESKNPEKHSYNHKLKTISEINSVIDKIKNKKPNIQIYVFCTFRAKLLKRLNLPSNSIFVTGDDGFDNPLDSLWLLSKCKHHMFNNSTFYWWGAWLSSVNYNQNQQIIYAANNFKNRECLLANWNKF